ncbi:MAG: 1-acyl-sn-glycerol-3-phosphate acyltransferase, partial [Phycisphaerales bacterium]|nr:1-acyl-sn-glycerol-3-phosphate acyltransferase [Phycisphaerales bacterium]
RDVLFRNPVFAWLIRTVVAFPIDHSKGDMGAIRTTLQRLEEGHAVLIFPEGSRTETGAQIEYKRGVSLLLKRSKVPVLPVAVEGCFDAWPRRRVIPTLCRHRVAVRIVKVIEHDDLMSEGADRALARLHDEVEALRQDLGTWMRRVSHGRMPRS